MKPVSLIFTLYNEQASIGALLESIDQQTRRPEEVVIVDAGSSDATVEQITSWQHRTTIPVRLIVAVGANIARGRNIAIEAASHELIAVTDGGCVLDPSWLATVVAPLNGGEAEVVYGGTIARGGTLVGRMFAAFYIAKTHTGQLSNTEHSSRSMAFNRSAWRAAGGYPEWLTLAGEDTLFFIELDKRFAAKVERRAIVYWSHGAESLSGIYRMHRRNGIGAGEANMWPLRHLQLIGLYVLGVAGLALAVAVGWWLLAALIAGLFGVIWSRQTLPVWRSSRQPNALWAMPLIMAVRDVGMMVGYVVGRWKRATRRP